MTMIVKYLTSIMILDEKYFQHVIDVQLACAACSTYEAEVEEHTKVKSGLKPL